jgi:hypothetical protein
MVSAAVRCVPAALAGGGLFEVGDAPVGGGELVFEADDAGGGGQGHVLIEQRADPHRQREICPAIAALPARGATRAQQPSGIQAAQKGGLHPEQLRGGAHGVGRVVNIVELARGVALGSCHRVSGALKGPWQPRGNNSCQGPVIGVGSTLSGGSPTGYRRVVREIPNRVIAMRESNAPSPPVSQSAAITSSRRNNLLLRAQQTIERTPHVVYPRFGGVSSEWWVLGFGRDRRVKPTPARGAAAGRRRRHPTIHPGRPGQTSSLHQSVTPTRRSPHTPGQRATQRHPIAAGRWA